MKASTQLWLWRGAVGALAVGLIATLAAEHRGLAVVERASPPAPILQSGTQTGVVTVWTVAPDGKIVGAHDEPASGARGGSTADPRLCASEWSLQRIVAQNQKSIEASDMKVWGRPQVETVLAANQIAEATDQLIEACGHDKEAPR